MLSPVQVASYEVTIITLAWGDIHVFTTVMDLSTFSPIFSTILLGYKENGMNWDHWVGTL